MNDVPRTAVTDLFQSVPLEPNATRRIDVSDVYLRAQITDPLQVDQMRLEVRLSGGEGDAALMFYNSDLQPPDGPTVRVTHDAPDGVSVEVVVVEQSSDDHVSVVNVGSSAVRVQCVLTGWLGWDDPGDDDDAGALDDNGWVPPDITEDDGFLPSAVDGDVDGDDVCTDGPDDFEEGDVPLSEHDAPRRGRRQQP